MAAGFVLNAFAEAPPDHRAAALLINLFPAISILLLACGASELVDGARSRADRLLGAITTVFILAFAFFDPFYEMNQSPLHCTIGLCGFGIGCLLFAEMSSRGFFYLTLASSTFWCAVGRVLLENIELLRSLGGRWGVGLWGEWKT